MKSKQKKFKQMKQLKDIKKIQMIKDWIKIMNKIKYKKKSYNINCKKNI